MGIIDKIAGRRTYLDVNIFIYRLLSLSHLINGIAHLPLLVVLCISPTLPNRSVRRLPEPWHTR